ncbi:unnamed protein product [Adineta ricciae]|uniref:Uncharacterized protein n=1 Tax=Adineta ricciae TaxID=249248 RepID=A0A815R0H1_ADIRI|nr:unnamed protein product [Adineta ricciae]CAF1636581.1 unnamed protein product [Adineta ricciae]
MSSQSLISLNTTSSHNQTNTMSLLPIMTSTRLIWNVSQNLSDDNTDDTESITTIKENDNNTLPLTQHSSTVSNVQITQNKTNLNSMLPQTLDSFHPTTLPMTVKNESSDASIAETCLLATTHIPSSSSTVVRDTQKDTSLTMLTENSDNYSDNQQVNDKNDMKRTDSIHRDNLYDDDSNIKKLIDNIQNLLYLLFFELSWLCFGIV